MPRSILLVPLLLLTLASFGQDLDDEPVFLTRTFLELPPSAPQAAMGGMNTVASDDPLAFYFNPGLLGVYGKRARLGAYLAPNRAELPPFDGREGDYRSVGLSVGTHLQEAFDSWPVMIGLGYSYGSRRFPDAAQVVDGQDVGTFEPGEVYNGFGIGVGVDYGIRLGFGFNYKRITSDVVEGTGQGDTRLDQTSISATDMGLLLVIPTAELGEILTGRPAQIGERTTPFLDFSIGWALLNRGDTVTEDGEERALPRTARLGFGINAGADYRYRNTTIRPLRFQWQVEAGDITVERDASGYGYQGGLGDIGVGGNLLAIKADEQVSVRKGINVRLLDMVEWSSGRIDTGTGSIKSSGWGVQTLGFFKFLKTRNPGNDPIDLLAERFSLRYFQATFFADTDAETTFHGLSLVLLRG